MAEVKHTPGPWYWNGEFLVSDQHGIYLMHTEECPGLGHAAEANKRLIAAAPEFFEFVLQYAKRDPVFAKGHDKLAIAEARALIAKISPPTREEGGREDV